MHGVARFFDPLDDDRLQLFSVGSHINPASAYFLPRT
jgi:hypothetical protein